ncbi:hypothetical protein N6L26_01650 [Qipengyuania sp. SS22]|uniref:hypothetical protein n=1 Tax=Qipengyuania sp. SS22 TaxID=2979461 RepID=UPI0021E5D194|nr:hypothetical protein [Qipengyuania sp. SS22]UYH55298.1 hypothetical protein N6L26_01650 [Qipengyuania sp. SS22]
MSRLQRDNFIAVDAEAKAIRIGDLPVLGLLDLGAVGCVLFDYVDRISQRRRAKRLGVAAGKVDPLCSTASMKPNEFCGAASLPSPGSTCAIIERGDPSSSDVLLQPGTRPRITSAAPIDFFMVPSASTFFLPHNDHDATTKKPHRITAAGPSL